MQQELKFDAGIPETTSLVSLKVPAEWKLIRLRECPMPGNLMIGDTRLELSNIGKLTSSKAHFSIRASNLPWSFFSMPGRASWVTVLWRPAR